MTVTQPRPRTSSRKRPEAPTCASCNAVMPAPATPAERDAFCSVECFNAELARF